MPPAARILDNHVCPMVNPGPVPHVGGPISSGSPNVIVGFMPAARVGDTAVCVPAVDSIARGSSTVLINNRQAARIADPTVHGGKIVVGLPTVIIGDSGQGSTLSGASRSGAPFCEECEKARKKAEAEAAKQAAAEQTPPPNAPPPDSAAPPPAAPPKPAATPATAATHPPPTSQETSLAASPGDSPAQRAARTKVANNFYYENARNRDGGRLSVEDIESHVRCIDPSKPVELVKIPPQGAGPNGDQLFQHMNPGVVGQYFTLDTATSTDALGVSPLALQGASGTASAVVVKRELHGLTVSSDPSLGPPIVGLKSTAAPATDTWSVKGMAVDTNGGGTQIMIPKSQQMSSSGGSRLAVDPVRLPEVGA